MKKRTMGLLISHKNNEKRRAILPEQVAELRNPDLLYFETGLGATVDVYGRKLETLFKKNLGDYDVIVNCVMWDISRKDHLIAREDLQRMNPNSMIIDVSCDPALGIETSHATTISDPVYDVDGVRHYSVDNTPAMFPFTITKVLSEGNARIFDDVIEGNLTPALETATVIKDGSIQDDRIRRFREERGLFCK